MKRWALAIAVAAAVCLLAWLGGFDFNERGAAAFGVATWALWASAVVLMFYNPKA